MKCISSVMAVIISLSCFSASAKDVVSEESVVDIAKEYRTPDMEKALELIREYVMRLWSNKQLDANEVFSRMRELFSEKEFPSEEMRRFIDDAMEVKNKYPLVWEFVFRSEYAKKAEASGLSREEVLQLASSEYIYLPKFVLYKDFDITKLLNETLMDLGCGILWKDRLKYLFVCSKYFNKKVMNNSDKLKNLPRRARNYLLLLDEISKLFEGDAHKHLVYKIAQGFSEGNVSQEKIMKILPISKKEWDELIKSRDYD